jgi:hypothetical protein
MVLPTKYSNSKTNVYVSTKSWLWYLLSQICELQEKWWCRSQILVMGQRFVLLSVLSFGILWQFLEPIEVVNLRVTRRWFTDSLILHMQAALLCTWSCKWSKECVSVGYSAHCHYFSRYVGINPTTKTQESLRVILSTEILSKRRRICSFLNRTQCKRFLDESRIHTQIKYYISVMGWSRTLMDDLKSTIHQEDTPGQRHIKQETHQETHQEAHQETQQATGIKQTTHQARMRYEAIDIASICLRWEGVTFVFSLICRGRVASDTLRVCAIQRSHAEGSHECDGPSPS